MITRSILAGSTPASRTASLAHATARCTTGGCLRFQTTHGSRIPGKPVPRPNPIGWWRCLRWTSECGQTRQTVAGLSGRRRECHRTKAFFDQRGDMIHHNGVKIISAELRVSFGGQHSEEAAPPRNPRAATPRRRTCRRPNQTPTPFRHSCPAHRPKLRRWVH